MPVTSGPVETITRAVAKRARWKVALTVRGAPEYVQSRLALAQLEGVSWYRRHGTLVVSAKVDAPSQSDAEQAAMAMLASAQVVAAVVASKPIRR